MGKHKHADLIHEWAEGATIERKKFYKNHRSETLEAFWEVETSPEWNDCVEYRIKPRQFEEGAWYPATLSNKHNIIGYIVTDSVEGTCLATRHNYIPIDELKWIGEKLEIDWPEGAE